MPLKILGYNFPVFSVKRPQVMDPDIYKSMSQMASDVKDLLTTVAVAHNVNFRLVGRVAGPFYVSPTAPLSMKVNVDAGAVISGTTVAEVAATTTGTITAPVSHPRIDRVVIVKSTGATVVVTGTEAASPSPPAIPSGDMPSARILLYVGMTTITPADITDERVVTLAGV